MGWDPGHWLKALRFFTLAAAWLVTTAHATSEGDGPRPALPPTGLTPAEQAIYEAFLREPPVRYHFARRSQRVTPQALNEQPVLREWRSRLTPESFARLARVYPELARRVEEGRRARREILDAAIARVERDLSPLGALGLSPAEETVRSFEAFVRRHQERHERPVPFAEGEARRRTLTRFGLSPGVSEVHWSEDAKQFYRDTLAELAYREQPQPQATPVLPERLLAQWKQEQQRALRARLSQLRSMPPPAPRDRPADASEARRADLEQSAYVSFRQLRLGEQRDALERTLDELERLRDPAEQRRFLERLRAESLRASRMQTTAERMFGPSSTRSGGLATAVAEPHLDWLTDLHWWGTVRDANYWEQRGYDRLRTQVVSWDIDSVLNPEAYARRTRSLWGNRARALALGLGLMLGGYSVLPPVSHLVAEAREGLESARQSLRSYLGLTGDAGSGASLDRSTPLMDNRADREADLRPRFRVRQDVESSWAHHRPSQIELPYLEHLDAGKLAPVAAPPEGARHFFTVTAESYAQPQIARGRYLALPALDGYMPYPSEIFVGDNVYQIGRDYRIVRTAVGSFVAEFNRDVSGQVFPFYVPQYHDTSPAASFDAPVLTQRELEKLAGEIRLLDRAGFTGIPISLTKLVERGRRGEPVRVTDLSTALEEASFYSKLPRRAAGESFWNPYAGFSHLLDEKGDFCGVCRHSRALLERLLTRVLVDHPTVRVSSRQLYPFLPGQTAVAYGPGHTDVVLHDPHRPGRLVMDPTARRHDPRGKWPTTDSGPRVHARPEHRPATVAFPQNPFLHRLRFRGRAVLVDEHDNEVPLPVSIPELKEEVASRWRTQEARNRAREERLRLLSAALGAFRSDIEALRLPVAPPNARLPHQLVDALAVLVRDYAQGKLGDDLRPRLTGMGLPPAPASAAPAEQLADALMLLRNRLAGAARNGELPTELRPFARFLSPSVVFAVDRLLQVLSDGTWSPPERTTRRQFAEQVLEEHGRAVEESVCLGALNSVRRL